MSSLSTSQRLVLATAAARADGAVLPLPDGFNVRGRARRLMLEGLIKRGLIADRPAKEGEPAWAQGNGDAALEITPEGRTLARSTDLEQASDDQRLEPTTARAEANTPEPEPDTANKRPAVRPGTKQALLVDLLRRPEGATIPNIQQATGWQQSAAHQRQHACSYVALVRVTVRAGDAVVCREACGSGHGVGATPGAAHESAIKEAETDAMKRALITFGNPFGLALYDPELRGVRGGARRIPDRHAVSWVVLAPDGRVLATYIDPLDFCAALRRQLEEVEDPRALKALWARHAAALEMLRCNFPELISEEGMHWANVLLRLYNQRREIVHEWAGTQQASASATEPSGSLSGHSAPERPEPRRVRDKEHLRFVASLPCLVCGRAPGQPHHIRFAQPRAMGAKPGDQWVVPLCHTHHRALHGAGNERVWWQNARIDPLVEAERLWQQHRIGQGRSATSQR